MSSDAVQALLDCHFGGPDDLANAHARARIDLYGLPPLDVAVEAWVLHGAIPPKPFVALALIDPDGRLLEANPGAILASDVALPMTHHDAGQLPEIEAGQLAGQVAGHFWDLRPLAQLRVPLAHPGARRGMTGLLYMARTMQAHPRSAAAVHLRDVPALIGLVPQLQAPTPPPIEELAEPARGRLRRLLHGALVKPWFRSRRQLARTLAREMRDATSLIDVSAGDDHISLGAARTGLDLVVLNDLAFGALETAARAVRHHRLTNVVLANQSVQNLRFPRPFDVAIIKNTLHHLEDAAQTTQALQALDRLGRRIVFVEIAQPALSISSRFWNFYYERILGDGCDGHRYLTSECFCRLLRNFYGTKRTRFDQVRGSRGTYMVCVVDPKEHA